MKTTHQSFSISFVCGPPGSGKSYLLTRDVVDRLVAFEGRIITNLPLCAERVAEHVAAKRSCEPADVLARIVILDRETLVAWQDGRGGPWDVASQADGNDFILDECHLFCSKRRRNNTQEWERWLGEARHEGWRRIVFVTQDESKVGQPITAHAELRFELTNSERLRDPFLKIPLSYWYELIASFTREYLASVVLTEYRRVKGRLRPQHSDRFRIDPFWFPFYRSYEAAGGGAGTGDGASRIVREFERRPALLPRRMEDRLKLPVWAWVMKVHWWRFAVAGMVVSTVGWVCFAGGGKVLLSKWLAFNKSIVAAQGNKSTGGSSAAIERSANSMHSADDNGRAPTQVLPSESGLVTPPPPMELSAALARISDEAVRARVLSELELVGAMYRGEQEAAAALRDKLEVKVRDIRCVAMQPDRVWFDGGLSVWIGERIDEGPLSGRKVVSLDWNRRQCRLDDGTVFRLGGGVWMPESGVVQSDSAEGAGVRQHLPAVGAGRRVRGGVRELSSSVVVGVGDEPGRIPAEPGGRSGDQRDRRGGARRQDGDDGSPGPAGGPGARAGGPAAGSRSEAGG
jgi:hypothetical protein